MIIPRSLQVQQIKLQHKLGKAPRDLSHCLDLWQGACQPTGMDFFVVCTQENPQKMNKIYLQLHSIVERRA